MVAEWGHHPREFYGLPAPGPEYTDLGVRLRRLEGVEYARTLIVWRWLPVRFYVGPDGVFSVPASVRS